MALKTQPDHEWSIREKLCLASAVMRSGDQNWMSVSRAIKPFPEPGRPPDWNTTRNCAIQYSKMLNDVDTPKRKRSGDKGDIVETPEDLIVKKLTYERIDELKVMIADDKKKFKLLREQIELIESGQLDEKLPEMITDIETKKRAAEAQKIAAEVEAAAKAASRASALQVLKKKPIIAQKRPSIEAPQTDSTITAKPSTETKEEETKEASLSKAPPSLESAVSSETTPTQQQQPVEQQQAAPTPKLLSTLLVSEKKEEKKQEPASQETILEVKSMLAGVPDSRSGTVPKDALPPVAEKDVTGPPESHKETPTLSKLLVSKQGGYQGSTPVIGVEETKEESAPKPEESKVEQTPDAETKTEEEEISVVEEVQPKLLQLLIPKPVSENEDSSDISLVASTAPSSPAVPSVKLEEGKLKKKKRGRPPKQKRIPELEVDDQGSPDVRSVGESADETREDTRSEAASEDTERPSESDHEDLSTLPGTGSLFGESLPSSPLSMSQLDDQQDYHYRSWKKALVMLWRDIASHKYANLFLHPVTNEIAPNYSSTVLRPMDMSVIKKNIENGMIRTAEAFHRDIMLMFQNAIMYNRSDHDVFKMAVDMQNDAIKRIEEFIATQHLVNNLDPSKSLRGREGRRMELTVKEEEKSRSGRMMSEQEHTSGKKRTRADEM